MPDSLALSDLADTIQSFPDPMLVFEVLSDHRYRLCALNQPAWDQFQLKEGAVGKTIDDSYFAPEVKARITQALDLVVSSGQPLETETDFRLADGSQIWMGNHIYPLEAGHDQHYLLVSSADVTDLVAARQANLRMLSTLASGFVTLCAWCNKIQRGDHWVEPARYYHAREEDNRLLCPDCSSDTP